MAEALCEATLARNEEEVPVGAILVSREGLILGRGRNSAIKGNDPTAHAEIAALRQAAERLGNYRLGGCTMVVTLEPCLMCVGAMVHARISGLVYGAADPVAGAVLSQINGLELPFLNHSIWQADAVLEEECSALLHAFFAERRKKKAAF